MKYLIITKGLANVREANTEKEKQAAIRLLKRRGYKKPMVFVRAS